MTAEECRAEAARLRKAAVENLKDRRSGHLLIADQFAMIADQYEDLAELIDAPNAVVENAA